MKSFSWQTPEYVHTERGQDWYWTVGIIAAALVATAIIFGDVLFGVVIAIAAFTLALFASRPPRTIDVEVGDKGVVISKTLFPYQSLESFSVDTVHHRGPRLVLKSKKPLVPLVTVPVMDVDPEALKSFLERHLVPETFEQSLMQTLFEKLGF